MPRAGGWTVQQTSNHAAGRVLDAFQMGWDSGYEAGIAWCAGRLVDAGIDPKGILVPDDTDEAARRAVHDSNEADEDQADKN
jgi:hypothetical protein